MEYRLWQISEHTGLTARQIRSWETCGLIAPRRGPGGQRVYADADLALLRRAKRMRDAGLPLRDVRLAMDVLAGRRASSETAREVRAILHRIQSELTIADELVEALETPRRPPPG